MEHLITFHMTAPIEFDGSTYLNVEQYMVESYHIPQRGTKFLLHSTHVKSDGARWVDNTCAYCVPNLKEFRETRQKETVLLANTVSKNRAEAARRESNLKTCEVSLQLIAEAFNLDGFQWETEVWREVAEERGQALADLVREAYLKSPPKRNKEAERKAILKDVRKALRPLMSEAKENAREEYPEDYSEEEDKEDFYERYKFDIADHIADNF